MSDNPYQTPLGEPTYQSTPPETAGLYVVSKKKFMTLFMMTCGIYLTYWFYRNWHLHKQATGGKVWPLPRAIFSVFFMHSLFRIANGQREGNMNGSSDWNHSSHATIGVLLLIIGNVMDRLAFRSIGSPITDYLSILILIPVLVCFASAQDKINEACGDALGESNSRFTGANYIWIFLGLLMWLLIGIGLFLPSDYPA